MAVKKKTKALILAAVCALIIAAIALSAVLIYRSTPLFALNEAGKYIDMGDYKSAIIALEEALIKFPDNADIRLALSEAYELSGDTENALRVLTEYIELYDVPENRRKELEHRIVKLGGSIDSAFGAITSGGATRNNDPGQDTDSTTASDLNNTVVYSSDNVPAELMGDPPASADEVVKMINDYLQYGKVPDREALKYVTFIRIAGNRCLWVLLKEFDTFEYGNMYAVPDLENSEETGFLEFSNEHFSINDRDGYYIDEKITWGTISDISFIAEFFPHLIGLEITFDRISDISSLNNISDLKYLNLMYNNIEDVSSISDLNKLEILQLGNNSISDTSTLANLNIPDIDFIDYVTRYYIYLPISPVSENNTANADNKQNETSNRLTETEQGVSNDSDSIVDSDQAKLSEGIEINSHNFPDDNFRAYIQEHYDKDNDIYLSTAEVSAVQIMNLNDLGISDLTGIEHFLELSELSFRNNDAQTLYLSNIGLKKLDVSFCDSLEYLYCDNNNLTEINVNGCPLLYYFDCSNNSLNSIDVQDNHKLHCLFCTDNPLSISDIFSSDDDTYSISYEQLIHSEAPSTTKIVMHWDGTYSSVLEVESDLDELTYGYLDYNYPIKIGNGLLLKDDEGYWQEFETDESTNYYTFEKISEGVYRFVDGNKSWREATSLTFGADDTIELVDLPNNENIFFTQSVPQYGAFRSFYGFPVLLNQNFYNGQTILNNISSGHSALIVIY